MTVAEREQQLDEVIAAYLEARAAGWSPDRESLLGCYPQLAPDLDRFFANRDFVDEILTSTSATAVFPSDPTSSPPRSTRFPDVPGYEVLEEIGSGGMGVVYKARQVHANRVVALKMILAGTSASEAERRRFRTEVEAVARLRHPGVVSIYEVGEHEGRPFFSMEHCPGGSLAERIDGTPLPPAEAAKLVESVAHAVQHAHEHGIIHRDLKPGNILLSAERGTRSAEREDDIPSALRAPSSEFRAPKVTDFGLAKRLDEDSRQTRSGAAVGTPSYMPPEQAVSRCFEITPATDVYALGAVLYELLTGRPPFRGPTPVETVLLVLSEEPVPVRRLQPKIPRDLETICLKCLQKNAARRYPTAQALADDLARFLRGEPVAARPVGMAERGWRWCRRNPVVAAMLGLVFLTLSATAALSILLAGQQAALRLQEEANGREQAALRGEADEAARKARDEATEAEKAREATKAQLERARANLLTAQLARVDAVHDRDPVWALDLLHDADACPVDLRDPAWWFYERSLSRWRLPVLKGHTSEVHALAWSPDGKLLASASDDHTVKLWDMAAGKETATLTGHTGNVRSVAFSPDGKLLASAGWDETVRLWDVATGKERTALARGTGFQSVAFSPDGKTLAGGTFSRSGPASIKFWDVATGQERKAVKASGKVWDAFVAFSPDGKMLASANHDGSAVILWDVATGKEHAVLKGGRMQQAPTLRSIAFSPDGKVLATPGPEKAVHLWDTATGQLRASLEGHTERVSSVSFSADGKLLASGAQDSLVKVWDVATGRERATLKGHTRSVRAVAFAPAGRALASAGGDGAAREWDVYPPEPRASLRADGGYILSLAFSPDGKTLASGFKLWDAGTGKERAALKGHTLNVFSLATSPDGRTLVTGSSDKTVKLWDLATGEEHDSFQADSISVSCVAFSPDGKMVATGGVEKVVRLRAVEATPKRTSFKGPAIELPARGFVSSVAFSLDGKTLAAGCEGGVVQMWDVATGRERAALKGHAAGVHAVAFSPDGKTLASAGSDPAVKLWDMETGKERLSLKGHDGPVLGIAFRPDGKTLATASEDTTVKLWDVATGQERATMRGHATPVCCVTFSPDGRTVASGDEDSIVNLWDVGEGR